MNYVLDSYAVLAYLEKEQDYEKVRDVLIRAAEGKAKLWMTSVNWAEVFYIVLREQGSEVAAEVLQILDGFPIEIVDVDKTLAKQAGIYKAYYKMSYADCFAAALAKINKAELITGDPEFKEVEDEIKILWLTAKASS